ncbi:hypothetical protein ACHAW6_012922 [Cyclotella cf. meneghiniana]
MVLYSEFPQDNNTLRTLLLSPPPPPPPPQKQHYCIKMPVPANYSSYHHSKYATPTANVNQHRFIHPVTHDTNTNSNTGRSSPQHVINANNTSASSPSIALSRLRLKSISHPQQQCQASIYVPSHAVGAVIGRGGRTILNVQREAMRKSLGHGGAVRISVLGGNTAAAGNGGGANGGNDDGREDFFPPSANSTTATKSNPSSPWNYHEYFHSVQKIMIHDNNDNDDDGVGSQEKEDEEDYYTPIIVRGDPVGCFAALRQILPLVDHAHDPHIVFEVPIHRSKHGLLLGLRGVVLASLSATFHVRIMIPPNPSHMIMTSGENHMYWNQQPHAIYAGGVDVGSTMLFPDANAVHGHPAPSQEALLHTSAPLTPTTIAKAQPSNTPPHILQLEGEIDNVEQCLVQMLRIVAGEPYFPTGVIVPHPIAEGEGTEIPSFDSATSVVEEAFSENDHNSSNSADQFKAVAFHSKDSTTHPDENNIKAVAVLTTTEHHRSNISQSKFRSIQRKTNTLIRRKKGRFLLNGVEYGRKTFGNDNVPEDEEGDISSVGNEEEDDEEEDDNEKDGAEDEDDEALSTTCGKAPISFVISGKVENVKAAVQQFERLLGLEADSSVITLRDAPLKISGGGENSLTTKNNDGGAESVENDKKKRNQRNKPKRKPMKNHKDGSVAGSKLDGDSG